MEIKVAGENRGNDTPTARPHKRVALKVRSISFPWSIQVTNPIEKKKQKQKRPKNPSRIENDWQNNAKATHG